MPRLKMNPRFLTGLILALAAAAANAQPWPPALPGAVKGTVTIQSPDFLQVPPAVTALRDQTNAAPFIMARTPPVVELAYHGNLPNPATNGTGWSAWGDICVGADGAVYCGIGDHGNNKGGSSALLYRWDPATQELAPIADLNTLSQTRPGEPTWSKVHAGIQEAGDGMIYFTGTLNDGGTAYKHQWTEHLPGGQIFRYDPKTGKSDIAGFFPGQCTATTLMDKGRNLLYANLEGKTNGAVSFSAFNLATRLFLYVSPPDAVTQDRNLALASNGCVYFNGQGPALWKFDPAEKTIAATRISFPGGAAMRSSTAESADGWIYGTTFGGKGAAQALFRFSPAAEKLEMLGPNFLAGDYVTVSVLSTDGKYVYFLPGAHGSSLKIGTPVVQYNVMTGQRKVIAFLQETIKNKIGYVPCGSYGIKLSADNATLYVNFNGHGADLNRLPTMKPNGFGLTAFAAIHIPASER